MVAFGRNNFDIITILSEYFIAIIFVVVPKNSKIVRAMVILILRVLMFQRYYIINRLLFPSYFRLYSFKDFCCKASSNIDDSK